MLRFCIKLLRRNVDSTALWARIGRDNLHIIDLEDRIWIHGTATEAEFYNVLEECLAVSHLSIEVREVVQ